METATTPGGAEPRPVQGRQRSEERAGATGLALPGFLLAAVLYLEVILRVQTDAPFFTVGLLYAALFAGVTALLVSLVAGLFVGLARDVVVALCLAFITLLFMSQFIYYDIFKTFYTVFSATNAGQVAEFSGDILGKVREHAGWLLLLAVPLLLFLVSRLRVRDRPRVTWRQRGVTAGLLVVLFVAAVAAINLGDKEQNSAYAMYYREQHPVASVNRLGLVTSMRVDLQRNILGFERELPPPPVAPPPTPTAAGDTTTPGDDAAETSGDETSGDGAEPPATAPAVAEKNVLDIDFEQLLADADSEELRTMHQYFSTREPTSTNEHTGLFEGYNLVFLTAEGYSHLAVDPVLTPTLYKMTHEGFNFTDFYTPIWGVSTSDGEYVATTGLIPKSGVWSMYQSGENSLPFTMGNQLRRLGYETDAFHNHTYDYYRRDVSHPNLGYDYRGVGNGLEVTPTWPSSDIEMIDVTTAEVLQDEPFHAYYMTVSGHLEYNFGGNFIAAKNRDLVEDLPYTEAGKAYLATQIELDRALELLLERLEEAGVADRTLIVLSSDHYPYGLTTEEIEDLAGHEVDSDFELYRNSLLIYAEGMEPETVDRPVSSLDIIPTISNLMGLEFDSRLLMGRDAFSDAEPLVIFSNRSFLTDQGRYNSITREFTPRDGQEVPDDYRQTISDEIDRQFYYSTMILDHDYYRSVVER
ncbi:LTA synthase family protein [Ornithinimicrobium sp. LYQ103]|uniref:LTA synthase family protein n=1 Tax=Ornithinimicrobium sp. LYQ103 TaxID=3378796 RepID=UPI0038531A39